MASTKRLTPRMREDWTLVADAIEAGAMATARQLALEAHARCGTWDRYGIGGNYDLDQLHYLRQLPLTWAFYGEDDTGRHLVMNPDALILLADWTLFDTVMRVAAEFGPGLVALDAVLVETMTRTMKAPDDLSELRL